MKIIPIIEYKTTLFDAFVKEQKLLVDLHEYKFFSNYKFNGYTECFKISDDIINIFENILTSDLILF